METSTKEAEKIKQSPAQDIEEGVGAKYHRIYSVVFKATAESAWQAMKKLQADPNMFSPQILAKFEKLDGVPGKLARNDHFQIHISGPWNGPVRVEDVSSTSFRLATLQDHLEAGEITFSIESCDERHYRFKIESLARSKDYLVDLAYEKIPIAKFAQTEMWKSFCRAFAEEALVNQGIDRDKMANLISEVEVKTERCDEKTGEWEKID